MYSSSKPLMYEAIICVIAGCIAFVCGFELASIFVVAGVICFCISLLINREEKKMDESIMKLIQQIKETYHE